MPNNYWRTPAKVMLPVHELQVADNGDETIGLDPFATRRGISTHVRADHYLREDRRKPNGGGAFDEDWKALAGNKLGYGNPPYGREALGPSMSLMQRQAESGVWLVNLVPSSTDVAWWHEAFESAAQLLFWRGRIKFEDPTTKRADKNSPLFSSCTFHWPGDVNVASRQRAFAEIFGRYGKVIPCGGYVGSVRALRKVS